MQVRGKLILVSTAKNGFVGSKMTGKVSVEKGCQCSERAQKKDAMVRIASDVYYRN